MRVPMVTVTVLAICLSPVSAFRAQSQIGAQSSGQITAQPVEPAPPPTPNPVQPAAPSATLKGIYRIAGTVLSAIDGHTLQQATVRIYPSGRPAAAQTATSDSSGQFFFAGLAAGTFVLEGSAPGFVSSMYEQHGNFNTGIVTGAGVDTESLVLVLQPQSTISLTLTDESGDPVERASVRLFRKSADAGDDRPTTGPGGNTDDLGHFHSQPLAPGTYYVVIAQAAPWYAVHPMPPQGDQQQPFGFIDSIQPGLDVAYPITYYPGATDSSGATPITLRGGDSAELSMQLRAEPAFTLTLPAPPRPDNPQSRRPMPMTQLSTTVFGQPESVNMQQYQDPEHIAITGLPPGDYSLRQVTGPQNEGPTAPIRITDHSISADLANQSQSAHVTAEIRAVNGSRVSRPSQVLLLRNREVYRRVVVDLGGTASFDIEPGDYTLDVQGGSRSLHLREVFEHDQPVAGNRIHLAAGAQASYVLSVVPGDHTVSGVVQRNGKPAAGVFVLLIPTSDLAAPETFYRDQSDLDGSFQLRGIAAGEYTLFAVQHGWELDWHKKATYDRYFPHAIPVHVADAAAAQKLPDPIPAQPQ